MTTESKVKRDFLQGKKLTTHGVFRKHLHSRLPAIVFDLNEEFKRSGKKLITGVWKVSRKGKRFKEYYLAK